MYGRGVQDPMPHAGLPSGFPLGATEARIIGSLIEKAMTTPDNYPLSLNAVTTACNQVSNRDPVVAFSEDTVERALRLLADHGIASLYHKPGDRVVKYVHKLDRALELDAPSVALLAVLLLRGVQTPGELRQRTQRYEAFGSLAQVEAKLGELIHHSPPLVCRLDRQPGQKEQRYRELISDAAPDDGTAESDIVPAAHATEEPPGDALGELVSRVSLLERRLDALVEQLGADDV